MQSKKVSVIVPVRDRRHLIEHTLRSIVAQKGADFCIIVVDNGSTDGTTALLEQLAEGYRAAGIDITVISEPRPGASRARNAGLAAARTPWVLFFDSDDEMLPGHISRMMEHATDSVDIVGAPIIRSSPRGSTVSAFIPDMRYQLMHTSFCATQKIAVRTDLIRSAGGWDASLQCWEDYELGVRLLLLKPRVATIAGEPLVKYLVHADSLTGTSFSRHHDDIERALERIGDLLSDTPHAILVNARRAALAALYARESHPDLARPMMRRALEGTTMKQRMILRLIYATVRVFAHGGSFIALKLL